MEQNNYKPKLLFFSDCKYITDEDILNAPLYFFECDEKRKSYFTPVLRRCIAVVGIHLLDILGFIVTQKGEIVKRSEPRTSLKNPRIPAIMNFLYFLDFRKLSALIFLALCEMLKQKKHRDEIDKDVLSSWVDAQPYLQPYKKRIIENVFNSGALASGSMNSQGTSTSGALGGTSASLKGLEYNNNSCYQDSVLFAILALPNKTIDNYILNRNISPGDFTRQSVVCKNAIETRVEIRDELRNIAAYFRGKVNRQEYTCSNLRKLLRYCKAPEKFFTGKTQDAGEFLIFLFSIFEVNCMTVTLSDYMDDLPITNPISALRAPICYIYQYALLRRKSCDVREFLTTFNEVPGGKYKAETIYSTPYLVFAAFRMLDGNRRLNTSITFPTTITLPENTTLRCTAVVVATENHYTCYILLPDDEWYFYNDNPGGRHYIRKVGSFDKLLSAKPSPETNGTLYFYT